ncbi:MAG: glycoside hydrolase family 2 TIM barrel-domain containing protein [Mangrovibacterium sp.]
MKKKFSIIVTLCVVFLMIQNYLQAQTSPLRQCININREWKFLLGDHPGAESVLYDDKAWELIHLPHSFSIPYFQTGKWYSGYGWYRKQINVPSAWIGKRIFIEFEGTFQDAEIFVNGKATGCHQGGYTGFSCDITDAVKAGNNMVAVRVNNLWDSRLPPRGGDHTFPGGIYRDVSLVVTNPAHVTWYGTFVTTPDVSKESGAVNVKTEIKNHWGVTKTLLLKTTIVDPSGRTVDEFSSSANIGAGETSTFDQTGHSIANPKLWHPQHPFLYKAVSNLYEDKKQVDRFETTFGFRWIEWTADRGFFLNGEHYYFKGVNVHQDHAGWNNAVTNAGFVRDIKMVKDAGMDFIRGSHYPHDPAFSNACDSLGILLWQENSFWSCGIRGNGGWYTVDGIYPPQKEDQIVFEANVKNSLREMIRIHRNHPSIIVWSMCNEPFFTKDSTLPRVREFLKELVQLTHELDPSRKAAVGGVQRGNLDKTGDIAGYNGDGARLFMNPGVPSVVSEYGSTITDRPGNYEPGWGDLQQEQFPWRSGQALWCAFDYGTHIGDGKFGHMGMIDYYRIPKRMWYWYRNEYRHIAPPEWPIEGIPAALELTADKTTISNTDGTDDVHLMVTVLDKDGKPISNSPEVKLSLESGPGEFPTGNSITFSPESDIAIRDGKAAIEFRSYYGGKSVIRATSPGLKDKQIVVVTKGLPRYIAGKTPKTKDRPYVRYELPKTAERTDVKMNLADQKPTRASNEAVGFIASQANDRNLSTYWCSGNTEPGVWWQADLENILTVSKLKVNFPMEGNYRYRVEVSEDGENWEMAAYQSQNTKAVKMQEITVRAGIKGRFLRITFTGLSNKKPVSLSEVEVFGQ